MCEGPSQRDRYIAFAFAAADVLIEINDAGIVKFATGSVHTVFGAYAKALTGTALGNHIDPTDAVAYFEFFEKLKRLGRASEGEFRLACGEGKPPKGTIRISAMRSPQIADLYHLSIKTITGRAARSGYDVVSPLSKGEFSEHAKAVVEDARAVGAIPDLAIMDLNFADMAGALGQEAAGKLENRLVKTMESWSFDGSGVGQVGPGRYSVLMDKDTDVAPLTDRLADTAAQEHPDLALNVFATTLGISDVIDTDDFSAFFENAMTQFDQDKAAHDAPVAKVTPRKPRKKSVDWRDLK